MFLTFIPKIEEAKLIGRKIMAIIVTESSDKFLYS